VYSLTRRSQRLACNGKRRIDMVAPANTAGMVSEADNQIFVFMLVGGTD
jgi:hypothetical protein